MSERSSARRGVAMIRGIGALLFAAALAVAAYAYAVWFGFVPAPWSWADGLHAAFIDVALFSAFALHHSVFARTRVKERITARVSDELERSLYVIVASVLLVAVMLWWRPVPGVAWQVDRTAASVLSLLQLGGVLVTLVAAHQLGLARLSGLETPPRVAPERPSITDRGLYGFVRHPIYFAWLLLVWPTPVMTGSRLVFAAISTLYLVVAVPFEERTLRRQFGSAYDAYRRRVRWRMLPGVY